MFVDEAEGKATFLIRRKCNTKDFMEIRIAVIGNVDAGKSTMLGVLTKNQLDDGRGKARSHLFRHKHEMDSGRTSSVGQEIMGVASDGEIVESTKTLANGSVRKLDWREICEKSAKLFTFLDLAGHEKYLKTTMFGLTGCVPDYAMLMVGSNAGMIGMAKEHLALAFSLSIPTLVVVTKIDMTPAAVLESNVQHLCKILKGPSCRRVPIIIKSKQDIIKTIQNIADKICPIFLVSNVSGDGLDLLKSFFNLLPIPAKKYKKASPFEFAINENYCVSGVGTVVSGIVCNGIVHNGATVLLGPTSKGQFTPVQIKGVHRRRMPVDSTVAGQSTSFALKNVKRNEISKGMVLLAKDYFTLPQSAELGKAVFEFEAEILILFHSTTIGSKYQAMMHCGVVRQVVKIVSMEKEVLRTGDRAIIRFRFIKNAEFLKVGWRLLFREGRTKGVGKILSLFQ